MALTYINIASNTLGTSATSVTFSSISSAYTDLLLKWSARTNDTTVQYFSVNINNNSDPICSLVTLEGVVGTGSFSNSQTLIDSINYAHITNGSQTASTFGIGEIYIPGYRSSFNKTMSIRSTQENNAAEIHLTTVAGLHRNTAAITSLKLTPQGGASFVAGSSFYLYGIKNL
jgi:hypothetical protein